MEKELTPLEKWNSLTLANNFIFCKVLEENPDVCKELLEMLLDIKIDRIEQPKSEQTFKTDFDSRGIRLDVYVKDGTGRCFDIEIQTSSYMQLAKRARYYQGLMDVDSIQFGQEYSALKDSYVIFFVPWGRLRAQASGLHVPIQGGGRQKYTHERRDGQHLF